MAGVGSVLGLLLGGALTTYVSWRWVLFINVPIAVLVLIGSRVLVPGDSERGSLDLTGAVTATLGIGSVVFGLTSGNTNGWNAPITLACFAAGAVLLAAFVILERTRRAPLVPLGIVRNRSRAGAYTVMLMLGPACSPCSTCSPSTYRSCGTTRQCTLVLPICPSSPASVSP